MAKKKRKKTKAPVFQRHHLVYADSKNKKDVTRKIRKGVHRICCLIRHYNFLTDQEINAIHLDCELKREFGDEE